MPTADDTPYGWWLPLNASETGASIDHLINALHVFMALLFIGWGIYLVYVLFRFRARSGHPAQTNSKSFRLPVWLEIAVIAVELFLLIFISSPIWFHIKQDFPAEKDSVVIRVIAEQFAWNIHYPGADGKFGPTRPDLISSTNPIGLDREDPSGKDDIVTLNELHIPVGKPVIIKLSSKDVIHSFFLPVLRVKQDAIPGMTIPLWFQANRTGHNFEIACAQLCGLGHFRMKGQLSIDTPEEYNAWLKEQEKDL
jgi:cytochrome c oxidase subunit II